MNGSKDQLIGSSVLDAVQEVSFLSTVNSVNDTSGDTTEKVPSLLGRETTVVSKESKESEAARKDVERKQQKSREVI